jgi:hypothetical protein
MLAKRGNIGLRSEPFQTQGEPLNCLVLVQLVMALLIESSIAVLRSKDSTVTCGYMVHTCPVPLVPLSYYIDSMYPKHKKRKVNLLLSSVKQSKKLTTSSCRFQRHPLSVWSVW